MFKSFLNLLFIRNTKFLYLSFFLFACAIGINLVTFPSMLKLHNISPTLIGLAFSIELLGIASMSFILSKIVANFGLFKVLKFTAISYSLLMTFIYFYQFYLLWLLIVFFLGCGWLVFAITRFSWLNNLLNNEERGVGVGIFSAIISLGVSCGPIIVKVFGAQNYLSFLISGVLVFGAFLCLYPIKNFAPTTINPQRISLIKFFKKNPNSFFGRFFLDFISYTVISLSVLYGVNLGYSSESSGLLITAYMASGFFDIFVGFMLKKIAPKKLINIGYLGCLYCFLIVSLYQKSFEFLLLNFFIFGLFIACIFVSVFKMINEDYSSENLVSANSTSQLIGTIGSFCGCIFGGIMMSNFEALGFTFTILFGCLFYLTFLIIYEKKYQK